LSAERVEDGLGFHQPIANEGPARDNGGKKEIGSHFRGKKKKNDHKKSTRGGGWGAGPTPLFQGGGGPYSS